MSHAVLDRDALNALVAVLSDRGYRVVGPTVRDDAIVLAELSSGADLPDGWGVDVAPGRYRLRRRDDAAVFAHSAGPQSLKQFLHPPRRRIWSSDGSTFTLADDEAPRYAVLGVRACDLAAVAVLGGVLGGGAHPDESYRRRRQGLFIVAVGCTEPGALCFCASLGTGPEPGPGYDLSLTERLDDAGRPTYLVTVGTDEGAAVLAELDRREATPEEVEDAATALRAAADRMGRSLPDADLPTVFAESRESPVWDDVAARCLTCGNCTMVCPTCFCTTTEDRTDLAGAAERTQRWASCFEIDYSYLHGGSVRESGASRYRQWITHKLGTWQEQFGTSGCVGCGRCIAWCPVGIDITAETRRLTERAPVEGSADVHRS